MTTLSLVIVLEDWFQVDTSNVNGFLVFFDNLAEIIFIAVARLQVLAASKQRIVLSDGSDTNNRCLFNASCGEGFVDIGTECNIVKELFGVVGFIFQGKCFILFVGQFEIQLTKNATKLRLSDMSLAEFVKIVEELFDSNALHNNSCPQTVLNI